LKSGVTSISQACVNFGEGFHLAKAAREKGLAFCAKEFGCQLLMAAFLAFSWKTCHGAEGTDFEHEL
jgi:hypothetical protein